MIVYLIRDKTGSLVIDDVILRDGCIPSITDVTEDKIEPGLWFKALVASSMAIDCSRRIIMWDTDDMPWNGHMTQREQSFHGLRYNKNMSRTLYTEEESYDYQAEMDEFFDTIIQLMDTYQMNNKIEKLYKGLLSPFHFYIIPSMTLEKKDLPKIQEISKRQKEHLQCVDREIDTKNHLVQSLKSSLQKERIRLVTNFSDEPKEMKTIGHEERQMLLEEVEKDIQQTSELLDSHQHSVDHAKGTMQSQDELNKRRESRDEVHQKHQQLLMVKEDYRVALKKVEKIKPQFQSYRGLDRITKSLKIQSRKRSTSLMSECEMKHYNAVKKQLQEERDALKQLTDRKILMLSVKESIRIALDDLNCSQTTNATQTDRLLRRKATDILRNSTIPDEWLPLPQRIGAMVNDVEEPIGQKHLEFVCEVMAQCKSILKEATEGKSADVASVELESGRDKFVLVGETLTDKMEVLKDFIQADMKNICNMLQDELKLPEEQSFRKLWTLYEAHFYEQTLEPILEIYRVVYTRQCDKMFSPDHKYTDEELGIVEPWLTNLTNNGHQKFISKSCHDSGVLVDDDIDQSVIDITHQTHNIDLEADAVIKPQAAIDDYANDIDYAEIKLDHTSASNIPHVQLDVQSSLKASPSFLRQSSKSKDTDSRPKIMYEQSTHSFRSLSPTSKPPLSSSAPTVLHRGLTPSGSHSSFKIQSKRYETRSDPLVQPDPMLSNKSFNDVYWLAIKTIPLMFSEITPLGKLQHLTKCLREANTQTSNIIHEHKSGKSAPDGAVSGSSSDDLLSVIVLIIIHISLNDQIRLYYDVKFLCDYIAPFLESGMHCYSLTTFVAAFDYISNQTVLSTSAEMRRD